MRVVAKLARPELALPQRSRRWLYVTSLALTLGIIIFPFASPNEYFVHIVTVGMIFAVLAASWDVLYGYTGQISFGHAGFFGVGAYTSALLSYYAGINPWFGLVLGGIGAALFGAVVAIPSLRLTHVYLAMTTLAFSEVARIIVTNWHSVTRGTLGFNYHPPLPGMGFQKIAYYYLALAIAIALVGFMHWLCNHSRTGLIMRSIRDDQTRASALGVNVFWYKMLAFVVSSFMAGVAGAFYAHYIRIIGPGELGPLVTILTIAMTTIGGIGSILGPAIAGVVIQVMIEVLHIFGPVYKMVAVGLMLMIFVLFLPKGFAGLGRRMIRQTAAG